MKIKYVCGSIFLVFLFLVGCGQKTVYVCSDGTEVAETTLCPTTAEITTEEVVEEIASEESAEEAVAEESAETSEPIDYTLSDAEKALLQERFTPALRAVVSNPLIKDMNPGDVYVAGLAVRNILGGAEHEFVVTIKFREAKDFSGSILETDDALIQAWMSKNLYTTYTLERSEEVILPVIIEVGETITDRGGPTLPGTYIFDVYVDYVTNQGNTDEYEKLLLTVQITE
jgi:hypothetical protein